MPTPRAGVSERRHWERLPVAIPVFVRGVDQQGKEFLEFTSALNFSAGGALLASRHQLSRRAQVSLEIPAPPLPQFPASPPAVRNFKARLVRVDNGSGCTLWGLRFTRPLLPVAQA